MIVFLFVEKKLRKVCLREMGEVSEYNCFFRSDVWRESAFRKRAYQDLSIAFVLYVGNACSCIQFELEVFVFGHDVWNQWEFVLSR